MPKSICIILLSFFLNGLVSAQYRMDLLPPTSPKTSISKQIGFTTIGMEYSSPSVKGRKIMGELLDYDEIWRAGADYATILELSDPVLINGVAVDSGKYALFIIPHETSDWEIILNTKWKQWGAFRYDSTLTAHVFNVPVQTIPLQERLTYSIDSYDFSSGKITLSWDNFAVNLDIRCSTKDLLEARLLEKLEQSSLDQEKAVLYLQLADFYEKHQLNKNLALAHILRANSLLTRDSDEWNKQYYPLDYIRGHMYFTKAKILYWNDENEAALQEIERCKALNNNYNYYKRNQETIENWLLKK